MSIITDHDVRYVAALARIHLKEEEVGQLQNDLEKIIGYINKLKELDVSAVEPTSHALSLENVFRPDEVKPSLAHDKALAIAIEQRDGAFKVPKVIE
ncbi:MAG: Asp-tRNA(Asn)/Glu-tRNA(Gln) amidotransferase subunit GatC [Candidatus Omnitrophica bacterium]|nr:Asp-tRNA(Asn)/Glu-tRNA(Gln) amidotransferase subunit GatC [Candidatus Omnitrophota bacterium]